MARTWHEPDRQAAASNRPGRTPRLSRTCSASAREDVHVGRRYLPSKASSLAASAAFISSPDLSLARDRKQGHSFRRSRPPAAHTHTPTILNACTTLSIDSSPGRGVQCHSTKLGTCGRLLLPPRATRGYSVTSAILGRRPPPNVCPEGFPHPSRTRPAPGPSPPRRLRSKCRPVDLTQSDHTAARGQPSTPTALDLPELCPRAAVW